MSVHNIDDARPHLVVSCDDAVHVVPVKLAIGWANGESPLPEETIMRKVFTEWLLYLTGEQSDVIQMLREDNERIARHYLRVQSDYLMARKELEQAKEECASAKARMWENGHALKAAENTIARQRAWIEAAEHRPGCASTRKCAHCGKPPWSYRHLVDAVGFDHDFQHGQCDCGYAELMGG